MDYSNIRPPNTDARYPNSVTNLEQISYGPWDLQRSFDVIITHLQEVFNVVKALLVQN